LPELDPVVVPRPVGEVGDAVDHARGELIADRSVVTGLTLIGNEFDNRITGTIGDDVINGADGGPHLVVPFAGGLDDHVGGPVDLVDVVARTADERVDLQTGQEIERLIADRSVVTGLTLIGNEFDNRITGNLVVPFAGGLDDHVGGPVDLVDVVARTADERVDAGVENGIVAGSDAFDLIGNALDNRLTGNRSANRLSADVPPDHDRVGAAARRLDHLIVVEPGAALCRLGANTPSGRTSRTGSWPGRTRST
jgi:hypothetical protein